MDRNNYAVGIKDDIEDPTIIKQSSAEKELDDYIILGMLGTNEVPLWKKLIDIGRENSDQKFILDGIKIRDKIILEMLEY